MNVKEQIAKEIHKPARRNFKRRKVVVKGIDNHWQCDLIDMRKYAKYNKGYNYMLSVIDVFSKFVWVKPVKLKSAKYVTKAMSDILKEGRVPKHLQADQGSEFYNKDFRELMKNYSINLYSTYSNLKSSVVERLNRTIKNIMWKRFTINGSYKWIDMLKDIVHTYNNKVHSTIKMKPCNVNKLHEKMLLNTVYKYIEPTVKKEPKFEVDDHVRISKYKGVLEKGYTPNFSAEIFQIDKVVPTDPVTYILRDVDNHKIAGGFYEEELTKVKYSDIYLVEKVLKRNKNKAFVKWLGFPSSKNSWIDKSELV